MQSLILFAKRPRLGRVKTRMVPPLTPEEALAVYSAFLIDQIRFLGSFSGRCRLELCLDEPPAPSDGLQPLPRSMEVTAQGPGDLGERLLRAFRRSHALGDAPAVVFGADCPTLPRAVIEQAFRRLSEGTDAVVAPAEDGGYVLIGVNDPPATLFEELPWGTSAVLDVTRRRAATAGVSLEVLESWFDVDDVRDLARLRGDIGAATDAPRAPATALALASLARSRPGVI